MTVVSITSNHNRNIGGKQTGNLSHNRRDIISKNVDKLLAMRNVLYKNSSIRDIYEEAFGDSIDEYISRQKRKDRIKYNRQTYFSNLFGVSPDSEEAQNILTSDARGKHEIKSFNEELFQVGDCYEYGNFIRDRFGNLLDSNGNPIKWNKKKRVFVDVDGNEISDSSCLVPNPKADIVREILSVFYQGGRYRMESDILGGKRLVKIEEGEKQSDDDILIPSFEERNPNFKVICAVLHNDEWHGTPHIHIDYVPVGTGYVKGPEKQVGFERALYNMGFTNKATAYTDWREKERELLKTICNYYGLETKTREQEQDNNRGETYSTDVYREVVRDAKADAQTIIDQASRESSAMKELAERTADSIRQQGKREAEEIKTQATQEAKTIIENAEQTANSIKQQIQNEAELIKEQTAREVSEIKSQAEIKVEEIQKKHDILSEENCQLEEQIEQNREQIISLAEVAKNLPQKKVSTFVFGEEKYEMNKKQHDDLIESIDTIKRLSQNTLTSDKYKNDLQVEAERRKRINDNTEREIKRQAELLANNMVQKLRSELKESMEYYKKLIENQRKIILATAKKLAENISITFSRLDNNAKIERLNYAYQELSRVENEQKESHEPDIS